MKLRKTDEERDAIRERREREKQERAAAVKASREAMRQQREQERQQRQAVTRERAARRAATTLLPKLGVAVRDGQVYKYDFAAMTGRAEGHLLGPLAGAHAEVTGGRAGHRRSGGQRTADAVVATTLLGPVGLLAAASRKGVRGTAFVVFADSTLHEMQIADEAALVGAQADAVRFNALANRSEQAGEDSARGGAG